MNFQLLASPQKIGLSVIVLVFLVLPWIWHHFDYPVIRLPDKIRLGNPMLKKLDQSLFDLHLNLKSRKNRREESRALKKITFPDTYWEFTNYLEDDSQTQWNGAIHFRPNGMIEIRGERFRNEFSNAEPVTYKRLDDQHLVLFFGSEELICKMFYPFWKAEDHIQFEIDPVVKNDYAESYLLRRPRSQTVFESLPKSE